MAPGGGTNLAHSGAAHAVCVAAKGANNCLGSYMDPCRLLKWCSLYLLTFNKSCMIWPSKQGYRMEGWGGEEKPACLYHHLFVLYLLSQCS